VQQWWGRMQTFPSKFGLRFMNLIYSRFKDCVTCTSMCSRLHETDLLLQETELSGLGDCLLEVAPCLHNLISDKLLRLSLQSMTRPRHGRQRRWWQHLTALNLHTRLRKTTRTSSPISFHPSTCNLRGLEYRTVQNQ
jgi:hypothetical protein